MKNVIDLPVITRLDWDADRILKGAEGQLKDVIIVGWDKDGDFYFAGNKANGAEVLWLLEKAKVAILDI